METTDHIADIKDSIIEKASSLFRRYGFKKTTMDDIASSMSKKKSSLYYYFANKEDVFKAVVEKEAHSMGEALRAKIAQEKTPENMLKAYLLERTRQFKDKANYYAALRSDYLSNLAFVEKIREKYDNNEKQIIQQILEKGIEEKRFEIENPSLAASALVSILKGFEVSLILHDEENAEVTDEQADYLIKILFYGIAKNDN